MTYPIHTVTPHVMSSKGARARCFGCGLGINGHERCLREAIRLAPETLSTPYRYFHGDVCLRSYIDRLDALERAAP